jgi:nucleoid DNA-binding protein
MLTKTSLVKDVHTHIISDTNDRPTLAAVERAVTIALSRISAALLAKETVIMTGVGRLSVGWRKETRAKNPKTKEWVTIPARNVVRFSAAQPLKAKLNKKTTGTPA